MIIRELATGAELNFGNVSEFAFTRDGKFLASVIDATDKIGNGVQLRNMLTGTVSSLDTDTANYERLSWTEKGEGLTVLKGKEDRAYHRQDVLDRRLHRIRQRRAEEDRIRPGERHDLPEGVLDQRQPRRDVEREDRRIRVRYPRTPQAHHPGGAGHDPDDRFGRAAGHAAAGPAAPAEDPDEKVDLVLWHWKDPRLQSQQEVQESSDRNFSYTSMYHVGPKKFVRLADDELRTVTLAPKHKFAIGYDDREYELMGNLDGRRFRDVYVIDPRPARASSRSSAPAGSTAPRPTVSRSSTTRTATSTCIR